MGGACNTFWSISNETATGAAVVTGITGGAAAGWRLCSVANVAGVCF